MVNGMNLELRCSVDEIREKFNSLCDFEDVASMLEVPEKVLYEVLVLSKKKNYTKFEITKKSGGSRAIYSPRKNLSILQKKFAYILSLVYTNHLNAHGFIKERSIVTNASQHLKNKYVLNLDLENYFESIKFPRVRAMFLKYFGFNERVASTLANICCHHEGFLPQGAATSPPISNIISFKLDKELTRVAKKYHCKYTRYADDITFSTKKNAFPEKLAVLDGNSVQLGNEIISIVKNNGFSINPNKTRLNYMRERLSVTGITVNEKLNVERKYIRRIRSILHCIEKNIDNIEAAEKIFNEKYKFRQRADSNKPGMFEVLRGMISHVGQVKGKDDAVFLKLAQRYNRCVDAKGVPLIKLPMEKRRFQELNTYVIEQDYCYYKFDGVPDKEQYVTVGQGTGFLLKGIGLVTNAHVIGKDYFDLWKLSEVEFNGISISRSKYEEGKTNYAKLLCYDNIKDIAILEVDGIDINKVGFKYNESITTDEEIQLIGYPSYQKGMGLSVKEGKVLEQRYTVEDELSRSIRYEISATVYGGNSGGPVVNMNNEVIALAVKGTSEKGTVPNEVIPIKQVIDLAIKEKIISPKQGEVIDV
jgi:V8-like Glu-specific endopeptidase